MESRAEETALQLGASDEVNISYIHLSDYSNIKHIARLERCSTIFVLQRPEKARSAEPRMKRERASTSTPLHTDWHAHRSNSRTL